MYVGVCCVCLACIGGCLTHGPRQLQRWHPSRAKTEYLRHACPKDRTIDMDFVRLFDVDKLRAVMRELYGHGVLAEWEGLVDFMHQHNDTELYPQHAFDPESSLQGGKPYRPLEKKAKKLLKRKQREERKAAAMRSGATAAADESSRPSSTDNGGDFLIAASEMARLYGATRFDAELKLQPAPAAGSAEEVELDSRRALSGLGAGKSMRRRSTCSTLSDGDGVS